MTMATIASTSTIKYPTAKFKAFLPPQQSDSSQSLAGQSNTDTISNNKGKRKRTDEAESSDVVEQAQSSQVFRKVLRVVHPKHYDSGPIMMEALRKCFKCDEDTTFFGTYHVQNAPEVIDKQRIQIVVHEILIATGYRFTVKDHPPAKNGHTTRLWCSQDIQRKNRNLNPRVSASGETMAKQRFPCRSRLLVSSRDAEVSGYKIITVRMYHHVQHEPYRDSSYPPLALRAIGASADDVSVQDRETETPAPKYSISASSSTLPPHPIHVNPLITIGQLQSRFATSQNPDMNSQPNALASSNFSFHISVETFQQRMHTHIQNIRDFCDGLEYQVQFNDTRMLQELEERGNGFLEYVKECLDREGRLREHEEREKEYEDREKEHEDREKEHEEREKEHDERGEEREEGEENEAGRERGQSAATADIAINDSIVGVS